VLLYGEKRLAKDPHQTLSRRPVKCSGFRCSGHHPFQCKPQAYAPVNARQAFGDLGSRASATALLPAAWSRIAQTQALERADITDPSPTACKTQHTVDPIRMN